MRRTKEDAAITREQVLDAALAVFSRKGYAAATLQDIAAAAGVTRGAVYWHFQGKAELYTALVSERFARAAEIVSEALSSKRPPLEALKRLLVRSLEYLEEDEEYRAVLSLNWFKTEVTEDLEAGFQQKIAKTRGLLRAIAELIRQGIEAGDIRREIEPRAAALAALGLLNGVTGLYLMDAEMVGSKAAMRRSVEILIDGLRA